MHRSTSDHETDTGKDRSGSMLRWALIANATFSGLTAVACLVASTRIADFVGLSQAEVFALGINLAVFAAAVEVVALQRDLSKKWVQAAVWAIISMDVLWVAGSALLLLDQASPLTTGGKWAVFLVAAAVADFALFQFLGWRRIRGAFADRALDPA